MQESARRVTPSWARLATLAALVLRVSLVAGRPRRRGLPSLSVTTGASTSTASTPSTGTSASVVAVRDLVLGGGFDLGGLVGAGLGDELPVVFEVREVFFW